MIGVGRRPWVELLDLDTVHLIGDRTPDRLWIEALQKRNYTLLALSEDAEFGPGPNHRAEMMGNGRVAALLRRNGRIRQALDQLRGYHVSPAVLVPSVLGMVSGLPTLLYRFVRRGDVNALVELLLVRKQKQQCGGDSIRKNKKRSRPS